MPERSLRPKKVPQYYLSQQSEYAKTLRTPQPSRNVPIALFQTDKKEQKPPAKLLSLYLNSINQSCRRHLAEKRATRDENRQRPRYTDELSYSGSVNPNESRPSYDKLGTRQFPKTAKIKKNAQKAKTSAISPRSQITSTRWTPRPELNSRKSYIVALFQEEIQKSRVKNPELKHFTWQQLLENQNFGGSVTLAADLQKNKLDQTFLATERDIYRKQPDSALKTSEITGQMENEDQKKDTQPSIVASPDCEMNLTQKLFKRSSYHTAIAYYIHLSKWRSLSASNKHELFDPTHEAKELRRSSG